MSEPSHGAGGNEEQYWERGWDGHERRQMERLAQLPMSEKLAWLEEAHRLVRQIDAARRAARNSDMGSGDESRPTE